MARYSRVVLTAVLADDRYRDELEAVAVVGVLRVPEVAHQDPRSRSRWSDLMSMSQHTLLSGVDTRACNLNNWGTALDQPPSQRDTAPAGPRTAKGSRPSRFVSTTGLLRITLLGDVGCVEEACPMTKSGSFKRTVRRRAAEAGRTYTEELAIAEAEEVNRRFSIEASWSSDGLPAHLQRTYGIEVTEITQLSPHGAGVFRVDRADGPSWVARLFHDGGRPLESILGDVEMLRHLERHGFPAERVAHDEPLSRHGNDHVLVTVHAPGKAGAHHEHAQAIAEMLGRLHGLPPGSGRVLRDGGAFGHDKANEGKPSMDVRAAVAFLDSVAHRIAPEGRPVLDVLRTELEGTDTGDGLPEALTTLNVTDRDVIVGKDSSLTFVDWKPAGQGPRIVSLAWLLYGAMQRGHPMYPHPDQIDLDLVRRTVQGYAREITPTVEELNRLRNIIRLHQLYMAAWYYWQSALAGGTPTGREGFMPRHDITDKVAEAAVAEFEKVAG
jgi:Ser/Thr protein kinase RdoA (MazF antagonist)